MLEHAAFNLCVATPLFIQYWNWMAAQWFSLEAEQRESWQAKVDEEFWESQFAK